VSALKEHLENSLKAMGIAAEERQIEQFERYHALLMDWNTRMDLTAVLEEAEMIDRHYIDSAAPLTGDWIKQGAQVIDVGTGAGFPGIPLAILRPDITVTLLDSLGKRCTFLKAAVQALGLSARVVNARAEDAGQDSALRECFDVVLSRAVAPLPVLLEYALPLARVGGVSLAFKGPGVKDEWDQGRRAAHLLGGTLCEPAAVRIPQRTEWNHLLVACQKVRPTPRMYPRRAGTPKKEPLA
jgi:16S rRNA (guanine527-N7)-methyltransferase